MYIHMSHSIRDISDSSLLHIGGKVKKANQKHT